MQTIKNYIGAIAVFAFIAACSATAARAETTFTATLDAAQQVPATNSTAVGFARVTLNDAETGVTISIIFSGLGSNRTAVNIHSPALPGANAPVLFTVPAPGTTAGSVSGLTQAVTQAQAADLRAGLWYFSVASTNFPAGEIRGQIKVDSPFVANFSGSQAVPANNSAGTGFGKVSLNATETQIVASYSFGGLGSNANAGHIHDAALPGANAAVLFNMQPSFAASGTVKDAFFGVTPAQVAALKRGQLYFDVHSANFPNGEIRGQILPAARTTGDFDADGRAELTVFRPSDNTWYSLNPGTNAFRAVQWGLNSVNDRRIPADFDGDGKADYTVWRPTDGVYYVLQSATNTIRYQRWGAFAIQPPNVIPDDPRNICDYDGDGKADFAAYRNSTTATDLGYFFILSSLTNQLVAYQWGLGSDAPIIGDFDGDRRCDVAVSRRSTSSIYALRSSDNQLQTLTFNYDAGAQLFTADFDGDGKSDFGSFNANTGVWRIARSTGGVFTVQFGASTDRPVPYDYDGDGRAEICVYRANGAEAGNWYMLRSSDNVFYSIKFGQNVPMSADVPITTLFAR